MIWKRIYGVVKLNFKLMQHVVFDEDTGHDLAPLHIFTDLNREQHFEMHDKSTKNIAFNQP